MQPFHLLYVVLNARDEDLAEMRALGGPEMDVQRWACERALAPGLAFTVLDDKRMPVACFGFLEERIEGNASIWLVATKGWPRYVKSTVKAFRAVVKSGVYRSIHAQSRISRCNAREFLMWLGFSFCGVIPRVTRDQEAMELFAIKGGT